jgi:hypothetical protein
MAKISPTQLTLRALRQRGYLSAVVEKWNQHARVRQDLFGFADILAVRRDKPGVLAIQATSRSNWSSRWTKCLSSAAVREWLGAGNRLEVWGWEKDHKNKWVYHGREVGPHLLVGR